MKTRNLHAGVWGVLLVVSLLIPGLVAQPALGQGIAEEGTGAEEPSAPVPLGDMPEVSPAREEGVSFPLSLEIHGRVQARLKATGGDLSGLQDGYRPEHDGFSIPRWRLGLTSQVFENVWVALEIGETEYRREHKANILDASIRLTYFDFANLILGAQKTPVGRNQMTSSRDMEFVERPLLATQLMVPTQVEESVSNPSGLGLPERDVGIQIRGRLFEGILNYYLGMFNGTGEFFDDNWNGKFAYTARVALNPLGDFSLAEGCFERDLKVGVGASFFHNHVGKNIEYMGYGVDLDLRWYGASIRFEWMESRSSVSGGFDVMDPEIRDKAYRGGWYVQAGYFVWSNHLQLVARFQQHDDSNLLKDGGDVTYTTVGANWYVRQNHNYKLQINYTWRDEKGPSIDNDALYLLAQVAF